MGLRGRCGRAGDDDESGEDRDQQRSDLPDGRPLGASTVIRQQSCLLPAGTHDWESCDGAGVAVGGEAKGAAGHVAARCAGPGDRLGAIRVPGGVPPERCDRVPAVGDGSSVFLACLRSGGDLGVCRSMPECPSRRPSAERPGAPGRYRWRADRGSGRGSLGARGDGVTTGSGVALATQGLAKRYGPRVALDGLDLRVPEGVVYGFLGPNGAGKTTTMRILTGLVRPDAGRVELLGRPFGRGDRRRLFEVGALIESPAFYPFLSGRENLRALAATGAPVPSGRIDELLTLVNLRDRAGDKVSGYSLGMKQRLGIAGALLSDPRLLLLDEPANGLDPAGIVGHARHAPRARGGRQDGLRVEPHPVRGPAARGRRRDHRQRPARPRRAGRGRSSREEGSVRIRVRPGETSPAPARRSPASRVRQRSPRRRGPRAAGCPCAFDPGRGRRAQPRARRGRDLRLAGRGGHEPRGPVPRPDRVTARRRVRGRTGAAAGRPGGGHEAPRARTCASSVRRPASWVTLLLLIALLALDLPRARRGRARRDRSRRPRSAPACS